MLVAPSRSHGSHRPHRARTTWTALVLLAAIGPAGACTGLGTTTQPSPLDNRRWVTPLLSRGTALSLSGNAVLEPTEERDGWRATVNLAGRGSTPSVFGWRVTSGACGSTSTVVGSPVDYPAIQLGSDGRATVEATFAPNELRAGLHSVRIYASPGATGQVVACGELRER